MPPPMVHRNRLPTFSRGSGWLRIPVNRAEKTPVTTPDPASVAGVFTQLLHRLDTCARFAEQMNQVLEAVHEATGAALVFWFNEVSGEIAVIPAEGALSAERCKQFAEQLLSRHPDCKSAVAWHRPPGTPRDGEPLSTVAVRLRADQPGWIFAVSLEPSRPLGEAEGRLAAVIGEIVGRRMPEAAN